MKTTSGLKAPKSVSTLVHWFHENERERHFAVYITEDTTDTKAVFHFVNEENEAVGKLWERS